MLPLPPTVRRDLERQLRKLTPWHVRVTVRSSAQKISVGVWSARWFAWQSSRSSGVVPAEDPLLFHIESICLDVQNFMRDEIGRWWPTNAPVERPGDGSVFANPVLPHASRDDQRVLVEWRQGDRILLTFDPLHLT